jgi:hypothetical protein
MLVTLKKIEALKPCKDRLDAYKANHATWKGTMTRFLKLPDVPIADKRWVYFRMIPTDRIGKVAADLAERVLHIYEAKYPGDLRPRKAIEAARSGDKNAYAAYADAAYAAYADAYAAYADAAYAAYAAAAAYAYAADAADAYAADAAYAAYAAYAYADASAGRRASSASPDDEAEIAILIKHLKGL